MQNVMLLGFRLGQPDRGQLSSVELWTEAGHRGASSV